MATKITVNSLADSAVTSAKIANTISVGTLSVSGNTTIPSIIGNTSFSNNAEVLGSLTVKGQLELTGQNADSANSAMTLGLAESTCGKVLFYKVSSALSASSTAKVFDTTTFTIPVGTYEVQVQGRAIYNGSNGGWSFGVERASGDAGAATALIFQITGESAIFNNTAGAIRTSPFLNLFGDNSILAAIGSPTATHRTGQAFASGLLVVTTQLVVVWYVAQVATDAVNPTTLNANSFLKLTKIA